MKKNFLLKFIKLDFLKKIDSSKGYIKGNIQVISFKANRLKNNGTIEEFKKIISYIETHQKIGLKNG